MQQWRAASRSDCGQVYDPPWREEDHSYGACLGPARSPVWVRPEMAETLQPIFLAQAARMRGTSRQPASAKTRHGAAKIDEWQAKYVNDSSKPLWYRGMLFNEMYILADGGTVWARPMNGVNREPPSRPQQRRR